MKVFPERDGNAETAPAASSLAAGKCPNEGLP